ncbi:hypothetical protein [Lutibacter sp. B1]|uniref:hypothetical protein n=1 Tax=Lutibacter sp. B1 TaxID=2725996 RepID=UPI0014576D76|nr:hypothetical protein [Lutibacter sp. B1]NLP58045.1 hypothetical protein [Lutibacter sp. B1]
MKAVNIDLNLSPIYQKSLDIFQLSRRVAAYITDDKSVISMYKSGEKTDNYADNLIMNSFQLVPKVVEVETEVSTDKKLKYAKRLRYFIDKIYQDCLNLERTRIHGKDFVRMLRKELISLRKIHKNYVNSIL